MDKKLRMRLKKKFEDDNVIKTKKGGKLRIKKKLRREPKVTSDDGGNKIYTCHVLGCGKTF